MDVFKLYRNCFNHLRLFVLYWRRIVFAPTGALLSPTSAFQKESIPGICHAVCISTFR